MPREHSSEVSGEDPQVERNQPSEEPYIPSGKLNGVSTPVAVRRHLDVDAVLKRSVRKVAGE